MIELIDPIISSNKIDISTGLNVHYLEASKNNNNQSIALLLHGFPELSFSWRKIIPILAYEGFRVIAPDMRGYGLTSGGTKKYDTNISEYRLLVFTQFNIVIKILEFFFEVYAMKVFNSRGVISYTARFSRGQVLNGVLHYSLCCTRV